MTSRAKNWLMFFLWSFAATLFVLTTINVVLYHNGILISLQQSFLPSTGTAFIFSMVAFIRPQY